MLWLIGEVYMRLRDREGLGLGDVKMMLTIGAFLGLPGALLTVFVGSIAGAIGGGLFIWLAKQEMTYELPFGAFLGAAALAGAIFGEPLVAWYWG
jgi:leader peptidase (prepilin peptidase)/N-methyltransferase